MQESNESQSGFGAEDEAWIAAQRARAAKREKKKGRDEPPANININSLMDILVIMLVFLLKSYGDDPIKVVGPDLKVPASVSQLNPEDQTSITISRKSILVNDKLAVDIKNGVVDQSQKSGGQQGMIITPLFDELTESIRRKKREQALMKQTYEPTATIIADQTTPYRLITEVMYTAGQAELAQFKFAVIKSRMSSLGTLGDAE